MIHALLDTNVILDALLERLPWSTEATTIWQAKLDRQFTAYVTATSVTELAKQTGMDAQVLSKVLSNKDTPLIDALGTVLNALGYQLAIKPLESETANLNFTSDVLARCD